MYNLLFKIIKAVFFMLFFLSFDGIDYGPVAKSENDLAAERAGIPGTANCITKGIFFVPKRKPLKM